MATSIPTNENKDVVTSLNYAVKSYDRPFFYARQKTEKDNPRHLGKLGGTIKPVEVSIRDGRGLGMYTNLRIPYGLIKISGNSN